MDLWVVKYASRRSRTGDFSGNSSVRGARIRAICKTGASSSGCVANSKRSGIGNENTHWRTGTGGMT